MGLGAWAELEHSRGLLANLTTISPMAALLALPHWLPHRDFFAEEVGPELEPVPVAQTLRRLPFLRDEAPSLSLDSVGTPHQAVPLRVEPHVIEGDGLAGRS